MGKFKERQIKTLKTIANFFSQVSCQTNFLKYLEIFFNAFMDNVQ